MATLGRLMQQLQLPPASEALLLQALTHPSFTNELDEGDTHDNQRLEFLGDAILDFICADMLYRHLPEANEGRLTQMRASLVSTEPLAQFARELQLGEHLRLGKGADQTNLRDNANVLADAFEALLGAVYYATGLDGVRWLVEPLLEGRLSLLLAQGEVENARVTLQERLQQEFGIQPVFEIVDEFGPDNERTYVAHVQVGGEVLGQGSGPRKRSAFASAAADALSQWEQIADRLGDRRRP
jgi:ribonuclease-3